MQDRPKNLSRRSVDEQLRFAIENKRLLEIRYKGDARTAEPHDYGVFRGTERLNVFQLRGPVRSPQRSAKGWRLLDVADIEECAVLTETFAGSRGQSHTNHRDWDIIYARVS